MISFTFAGKDSYKDYGIIVSKRPNLPSSKRRVSYIDIPGRDSSLIYDERTYENITIGVECKIKDGNLLDRIDEIKAWLFSTGESDLIFSFQNDKKYRAQVVNSIDFSQIVKIFSEFIIVFNCRPFKYSIQNNIFTITESGSSIINIGSIKSEPIISVYGEGNIELIVNGTKVNLTNIKDKIILNSVIQDSYNDERENLNNKVKGESIYLMPGSNKFEWTGNVSKIEVLPNWRWL
ncbi:phage tail family protein [Tissierella carlieri]|uniref:Phage tail family protein n=1 Tax=Tissierella carlieri TaxID=689904 RepID=A0ABT1S6U2_9FIRM|nr:phage tail family protein [Tissierella carlieri]